MSCCLCLPAVSTCLCPALPVPARTPCLQPQSLPATPACSPSSSCPSAHPCPPPRRCAGPHRSMATFRPLPGLCPHFVRCGRSRAPVPHGPVAPGGAQGKSSGSCAEQQGNQATHVPLRSPSGATGPCGTGPRAKCGQRPGSRRKAAMERCGPAQRLQDGQGPRALQLCSVTLLLGAALLLPAPGGTQVPSDAGHEDLAAEQDLPKEIILGARAVEPPQEAEMSKEVVPGIKVFSSSTVGQGGPSQAQAGPEKDLDHLYHPEDRAREADVRGPPRMPSPQVQRGPEKDLDHLHHG
ncbi:proline-rich acidic protein 1 [Patagioenas fasciata]|uniref:proline-rich acidic protein 1 n=1 Tax=Patagioenas fasciata TaxID=372321 RepID=UPI003A9A046E